MRLINVSAFLDLDSILKEGKEPKLGTPLLEEAHSKKRYAILSHCWGASEKEIQLEEMENLPVKGMLGGKRDHEGYQKILRSSKQARKHNLDWIWVDVCCMDDESRSKVNDSFRWFKDSEECYVYLHDIDDMVFPTVPDPERFPESGGWPKWFSRSWTLQELVAPRVVYFFNRNWKPIGNKKGLASTLSKITRIPAHILEDGLSESLADRPSVAQIMSWAADRRASLVEDQAYSLLGLFGVEMSLLYGEGKDAFRRLQLEIILKYKDPSIFAWHPSTTAGHSDILADDPSCFRNCVDVVKMERGEFLHTIGNIPQEEQARIPEDFILGTTEDELLEIPEERLRTLDRTLNPGIQIWLPLTPYRNPTLFKAKLACCRTGSQSDRRPLTVTLARSEVNHYSRSFDESDSSLKAEAQCYNWVLLPYCDPPRSDFKILLSDNALSHDEFTPQYTFPEEKRQGNTLTLSGIEDYVVVVYKNPKAKACFAVAFRSRYGVHSVQFFSDDSVSSGRFADHAYARDVFSRVRQEVSEEIDMVKDPGPPLGTLVVKHAHLFSWSKTASIRTVYGQLSPDSCSVTIDIIQCPGDGCTRVWKELDADVSEFIFMGLHI